MRRPAVANPAALPNIFAPARHMANHIDARPVRHRARRAQSWPTAQQVRRPRLVFLLDARALVLLVLPLCLRSRSLFLLAQPRSPHDRRPHRRLQRRETLVFLGRESPAQRILALVEHLPYVPRPVGTEERQRRHDATSSAESGRQSVTTRAGCSEKRVASFIPTSRSQTRSHPRDLCPLQRATPGGVSWRFARLRTPPSRGIIPDAHPLCAAERAAQADV